MKATKGSDRASKRGPRPRSSPESGAAPSRSDGDNLAGVMGAYLQIFSRPPLGDHPQMDGFTCGHVLAEEYPDAMMEVMEGFRQGVKSGTEAAQRAGGQRDE